jgi:NAD(P)H-hydrate epimerase
MNLMKVLLTSQRKEIDKLTIQNEPVSSLNLMERASRRFTEWFTAHFPVSGYVKIFAGTGNNGGDALAIARMLIERNYKVKVYLLMSSNSLSNDCEINLSRLKNYISPEIFLQGKEFSYPEILKDDIIIDGIFGSGLNRPADGIYAGFIQHINKFSQCTVSIDIPSGLFGEDNRNNIPGNIIRAHHTVSFEFPFLSFFMSENEDFTGNWKIVPIGLHLPSLLELDPQYTLIDRQLVRSKLKIRKKFSHKGNYGHALIISGRHGMMGAAVLCSRACLRGGAGLVTACIPESEFPVVQQAVPEALVLGSGTEFFSAVPELSPFQAVACGPATGLIENSRSALINLINSVKVPLVLDADALTILSGNKKLFEKFPENTVITPHPKEFDRLIGESPDSFSRHLKQIEFAKKYRITVILKGAHTIICTPEGESFINSTGNPGMASGGSGDVLTGLLVSFLAQGYSVVDSAIIAVYIHGLAGDIALMNSSWESLIATDIIENLGQAFNKTRSG